METTTIGQRAIYKHFFQFSQVTETDDAVIIILSSARPDRDDEVGHRQNIWLENTLKKYREKIVAIHHHLIPVPDTGADQITIVTIVDASDVLRSLTKSNVNLVLCGHRHRPWRWKIEDMLIMHARSVSCEKLEVSSITPTT
ncbi:MAG: hypothetical protein QXI91_02290 [Candidatus Bathyarchaeia archaeon]